MIALLFETDAETQQAFRQLLRRGGHKVVVAASPGDLEDQIDRQRFDLCVLDLDSDIREVVEVISKRRAIDPAFVALCTTASNEQGVAVRAFEAGARGFLKKPASEQEIQLKLSKLIGERNVLAQSQHLLGDLLLDRSDLRFKVAERERFLGNLIDAAPFAIFSTDHDGKIVSFNSEAVKLYGYEPEEILGMPCAVLFGTSEPITGRTQHVNKDGVAKSVFAWTRHIVNEIDNHVADLHIVEDLAEKEQSEDQLIRAERRSLLGQLAPQIGHEFKSPISVILGVADLMKQDYQDKEIQDWLDKIIRAAEEMSSLVTRMMELGKPSEACQEKIDLGVLLRDVLDSLEPIGISKHLEIDLDISSPIPTFLGDPNEIRQVIRNLVINAMYALEAAERNALVLRVYANDLDITLEVEDAGIGIPKSELEKAFEPFFTTKAAEGTGLGLSVVRTIVERHHGSIDVNSEEGVGTTYTVRFPAGREGEM